MKSLVKQPETGQVLPLALILLAALFVTASFGLGVVKNALSDRSRAQTAADAAALAGAIAGESAARSAANANGAQLIQIRDIGNDTLVTARVGSSEAQARARQGRWNPQETPQ